MSNTMQIGGGVAALPIVVSLFDTAKPEGPALGVMKTVTWAEFTTLATKRREGSKDGANLVPAEFTPEEDGQVRRVKKNLVARTMVALDCETHSKTGEVPPPLETVVDRLEAQGWAATVYTSHNHSEDAPRYRIFVPMTKSINPALPAVEVVAELLGLDGVLDRGKIGASSLFYLPSAAEGHLQDHHEVAVDGAPIAAQWMEQHAGAILSAREAKQAREREEAAAEAQRRRAGKARRGFNATDNLIAGIRDHLDLAAELAHHGYTRIGDRYLYPHSETGVPGVHVIVGSDGIERVFSHHSGDPLAAGNLPAWCRAKAIDVVDLVTILDYAGDLKKALYQLGNRFGISGPNKARPHPEPPPGFDDVPPPDEETATEQTTDEQAESSHKAGKQPSDTSVWTDPLDFFQQENGAAPTIGPQHVPAAIWPFVTDTAARLGVDPFSVALCAIVSAASIMCDDWAVQPKRFDTTWTENPRLWGAIVGDPSILKTPVIKEATKPIDAMEVTARERHKEEVRRWRIEENAAKQAKEVLPPKPKLDRYLIEGITTEAIGEILRDDDEARMRAPAKKVLSRHDEMSEFFGGLDRYKSGGTGGGDRGAYLRLYNGGRYTIDRISRGNFACPNWSACFLGGCQPGPIQRIAREAADDGLLQRFVFCVPHGQGKSLDREPDHKAALKYSALFPALAALLPARAIGGEYVRPVVFHTDAHRHREDVDALAQALTAMPDTSTRLKSVLGKWPGLFARLALTFQLIEVADHRASGSGGNGPIIQVIPERIARQVAMLMREIVLPHQMRAEAVMFATDQTSHARWIAGYILSKKLLRITTRDIVRDYRALAAPEAKRELHAVMASLTSVAWVDPEEPNNPARGVVSWQVNPKVHEHFAEQGKAEAARRAKAREQIAEAVARARASVA